MTDDHLGLKNFHCEWIMKVCAFSGAFKNFFRNGSPLKLPCKTVFLFLKVFDCPGKKAGRVKLHVVLKS